MSTPNDTAAPWTDDQLLRTVILGLGIEVVEDYANPAEFEADLELLTGWRQHTCHLGWDECGICADGTRA